MIFPLSAEPKLGGIGGPALMSPVKPSSTGKFRHNNSPPKAGRKNEHLPNSKQTGNNNLANSNDRNRRGPEPAKANNDLNLNVYSSVFVPSNYDYWSSQHDRNGLVVTV